VPNKLFKSANVSRSYSKNNIGTYFLTAFRPANSLSET